jgi:hypothetical protein
LQIIQHSTTVFLPPVVQRVAKSVPKDNRNIDPCRLAEFRASFAHPRTKLGIQIKHTPSMFKNPLSAANSLFLSIKKAGPF